MIILFLFICRLFVLTYWTTLLIYCLLAAKGFYCVHSRHSDNTVTQQADVFLMVNEQIMIIDK